jgi:hypothetical protein
MGWAAQPASRKLLYFYAPPVSTTATTCDADCTLSDFEGTVITLTAAADKPTFEYPVFTVR